MAIKQGFECETGTSFLSCEVEGDLLVVSIEDRDEDEAPYIEIGISQICNLIEFLLNVRNRLPSRNRAEHSHVSAHVREVLRINKAAGTEGYFN